VFIMFDISRPKS